MSSSGAARLRPLLLCLVMVSAPLGAQDDASTPEAKLLLAQNHERARLNLSPLQWDSALAADARRWAAQLAQQGTMMHSTQQDGHEVGENLWAGTTGAYSPEEMVGVWLDERAIYKPGVFPANSTTGSWHDVGHYTQIIWAQTRHVGCAIAKGAEMDFLVCQYRNGGNVIGQRPI